MPKCIFDKKASLKGYHQCEITNQIKCYSCYDNHRARCKHFKMSLISRFINWLTEKLM